LQEYYALRGLATICKELFYCAGKEFIFNINSVVESFQKKVLHRKSPGNS